MLGTIFAAQEGDESDFIDLVRRVVAGELGAKTVDGLFLIRIDNWFDRKWRNFSGIGRVAYGHHTALSCDPDTSLEAFHRKGVRSTFPPFTPNRVVSEQFYGRDQAGAYSLDANGPWVHSSLRQQSSANLYQRIAANNNSALFVWFSSNSLSNGRGSLMVYRANGNIVTSWYASFSRDDKWRVVRTDGITRQNLFRWLAAEPALAHEPASPLIDRV